MLLKVALWQESLPFGKVGGRDRDAARQTGPRTASHRAAEYGRQAQMAGIVGAPLPIRAGRIDPARAQHQDRPRRRRPRR